MQKMKSLKLLKKNVEEILVQPWIKQAFVSMTWNPDSDS